MIGIMRISQRVFTSTHDRSNHFQKIIRGFTRALVKSMQSMILLFKYSQYGNYFQCYHICNNFKHSRSNRLELKPNEEIQD